MKVYPGPEGKAKFQNDVRRLLGLREDQTFHVNFECQPPGEEGRLELPGIDAFEAARFCASVTAGVRAMERARVLHDQGTNTLSSDELEGRHEADDTMPFSPRPYRNANASSAPGADSRPSSFLELHHVLSSRSTHHDQMRSSMVISPRPGSGSGSTSSAPVSPSAIHLAFDIAQRQRRPHEVMVRNRSRMANDQAFIQSSLLLVQRASGMMGAGIAMEDDVEEEQ